MVGKTRKGEKSRRRNHKNYYEYKEKMTNKGLQVVERWGEDR
jgi:hypothetical protein